MQAVKRKFPTDDQISIAVAWLDANEGEGEEAAACRSVANWLKHDSDERYLKQRAREARIPLGKLRRALEAE